MHDIDLIVTLTAGLFAALVGGLLAHRFGLSLLVGYLIAGYAIGPHSPGFVANREIAEQLAEIGVILLMFGVGLEFHLEELLAVRKIAVPGALGQSFLATLTGALVAKLAGWDWAAATIFGLALSVASTVVLMRVLADNRDLHTPTGHIAVGWLVVEDLLTVAALVLLPAAFGGDGGWFNVAKALALATAKIALLVTVTFVVGRRAIPWLLGRVAITRSRELFTLTVLVVALGIAVGAAKFFGVSMALGAFLAGVVVGASEFSHRAASEALPMRDAFAVLFFVSVGMLLDPNAAMRMPWLIVGTTVVVLVAKPAAALAIVLWFGYPMRIAVALSAALAQIGEFSFILASLGKHLGKLPTEAMDVLAVVAIASMALNPFFYRATGQLERLALAIGPLAAWAKNRRAHKPVDLVTMQADEASLPKHRAIVVGYGPVGQTVARLLESNEIVPTIIEMNLETVRRLIAEGKTAIYGDAAQRGTLENAGIAATGTLILTASEVGNAAEIIRLARDCNPQVRILARTTYVRQAKELLAHGADSAYAGESEVGLALATALLRDLGATPEQIDREREMLYDQLRA